MNYLNDSNFKEEIGKQDICIVDFFADWCGPCKVLGPVFEEVSKDYSTKLSFFKINVDDANIAASEYGVMSIPTIIIFKNGKRVASSTGALSKDQLKSFIDSNI